MKYNFHLIAISVLIISVFVVAGFYSPKYKEELVIEDSILLYSIDYKVTDYPTAEPTKEQLAVFGKLFNTTIDVPKAPVSKILKINPLKIGNFKIINEGRTEVSRNLKVLGACAVLKGTFGEIDKIPLTLVYKDESDSTSLNVPSSYNAQGVYSSTPIVEYQANQNLQEIKINPKETVSKNIYIYTEGIYNTETIKSLSDPNNIDSIKVYESEENSYYYQINPCYSDYGLELIKAIKIK